MSASHHRAIAGLDALMLRIAEGDRKAVQQLYVAFAMKLFAVALRILADRAEAEDVVQDVFVTIWRKAAEFDPTRASAEAWLVAITRNRAIDRMRARTRRAAVPDTALAAHADPSARADACAEQSDAARAVGTALEGLEDRHAAVIRAAYFDGLTYEEIAAREAVPVGTVKTWVFRGLRRMRSALDR